MKYSLKVIDAQGNPHQHELDFASRDEVLKHCRAQRWTVLDLRAIEAPAKAVAVRRGWEPFGIRPATLVFFTSQLSQLVEAGIPLVQTLETLKRFSPSAKMQDVIADLIQSISGGKGFADSLRRHPQVFSKIYVGTVEVGEKTGDLATMMKHIADYLEREEMVRSKLKSALQYPTFILVFSLLLTYFMVAFLLPGFTPMFNQAGLDLNRYPITLMLMKLSAICTSFVDEVLVVGLVGAMLYAYRRFTSTTLGRTARDRLLLRLPVVGEFVQLATHARVCQTLALMQDAGVPIYQAVATAAEVSGNEVMAQALDQVRRSLESGKALSVSLGESEDAFPPLMVQMVSVGEQTGDVPKMLSRVAHYYESQLENSIKGFSSMVEPLMMLVVGGIVGTFVLGVFGPIMGIVGALQSKM